MLIPGFGFIIGAVIGSFIDCIANRSLTKESFWGRSYCDHCKKKLNWYDLFPVFSYLLNSGKCRYCKTKLTSEYLLIEVLTGLLVVILFQLYLPKDLGPSLKWFDAVLLISDIAFKIFVIGTLIAVFITDIKKGLIPDRITYPAITITFFYFLLSSIFKIYLIYLSLVATPLGKFLLPPKSDYLYRHAYYATEPFRYGLLAAFLLGGFFLALILVTKGRGMGGGDFKLGIFLGFVLGVPNSIVALLIAFLSGSIAGLSLLLFGKKKFGQTIPFGPFLSLGALITLFWGDQIVKWYLNLKY